MSSSVVTGGMARRRASSATRSHRARGPHQWLLSQCLLRAGGAEGLHQPGFSGAVDALLEVLDGGQLGGHTTDPRGVLEGPLAFGSPALRSSRVYSTRSLCVWGAVPSERV
ncbi:hypothetical protein [Streptomyces gilvosporeus]|nr:hypothetical protein [Streptomyces gilvosporeus]